MQTAGMRRPDYELSECIGAQKAQKNQSGRWFFMSTQLAPPLARGWQVAGPLRFQHGTSAVGIMQGLTSVAKGLAQMGVGLAVLTETELTDNPHAPLASGFKIFTSKVTSHNQGGIALLWKENHPGYKVESACIVMPNLLTFQLVTGGEQFYCSYGASLGCQKLLNITS